MTVFRLLPILSLFVGLALEGYADQAIARETLTQLEARVVRHTLPNGVRVIIYPRGEAPVFSGAVVVRVGGTDEPFGKTGISHLFEHMAFKGTRTIGTRDYAKEAPLLEELEQIAGTVRGDTRALTPEQRKRWDAIHAELKGIWDDEAFSRAFEERGAVGFNATTDKELTRYFVSLPSSELRFWAAIERARLTDPVMRQFYTERDVVLEERRMRVDDSPEGKLYELLLGTAFLKHPYRFPVIGYEEDIRRLTATDLEQFRRQFYVGSNIVVSIVGGVDPEQALAVVREEFSHVPAGPRPARPFIQEAAPLGERMVTLNDPAAPELFVSYPKPNYPHPDDPALSVLSEILGSGRTSVLFRELIEQRKLALAADVSEGPGFAYPNLFSFSISPKAPHDAATVLAALDEVLVRVRSQPPTEREVARAKRAIAMSTVQRLRGNLHLALDLAGTEALYDDWRVSLTWFDEVMRVTRADVQRVAERYLAPERRTVAKLIQRRGV